MKPLRINLLEHIRQSPLVDLWLGRSHQEASSLAHDHVSVRVRSTRLPIDTQIWEELNEG